MLIDAVGIIGVGLIVIAYFLLQKNSIAHTSGVYLILNGVGASLILFTLFFDWNLSAAIIEVFWILISIFGYLRSRKT